MAKRTTKKAAAVIPVTPVIIQKPKVLSVEEERQLRLKNLDRFSQHLK